MPTSLLQQRFAQIEAGLVKVIPENALRFLCADAQPTERPLPCLATPEGQGALMQVVSDAELVIFDNCSTLFSTAKENDADSWAAVQAFLLALRRSGRSAMLVHHAGKSGAQRGSSRREDALDTVLALRPPEGHDPEAGCSFVVTVEKARGAYGAGLAPFQATLDIRSGAAGWMIQDAEDSRADEIRDLSASGQSIRQIAAATGLSKSAVQRALKR